MIFILCNQPRARKEFSALNRHGTSRGGFVRGEEGTCVCVCGGGLSRPIRRLRDAARRGDTNPSRSRPGSRGWRRLQGPQCDAAAAVASGIAASINSARMLRRPSHSARMLRKETYRACPASLCGPARGMGRGSGVGVRGRRAGSASGRGGRQSQLRRYMESNARRRGWQEEASAKHSGSIRPRCHAKLLKTAIWSSRRKARQQPTASPPFLSPSLSGTVHRSKVVRGS